MSISGITDFIEDIIQLINTIIDITNLPEDYLDCVYTNKIGVNLEDEVYQDVVENFKYTERD